jgi:hypothetical protein
VVSYLIYTCYDAKGDNSKQYLNETEYYGERPRAMMKTYGYRIEPFHICCDRGMLALGEVRRKPTVEYCQEEMKGVR